MGSRLVVSESNATRPAEKASAIQASSRSRVVTVSYLLRSMLSALAAAAAARTAASGATGVTTPGDGPSMVGDFGRADDGGGASPGAASGPESGGTATPRPSAMRLVIVV